MARKEDRRREFSQNFLHDQRLAQHLVETAGIGSKDLVIEIGPGDGALTAELIRCSHLVLAVEADPRLVNRLRSRFRTQTNFALFEGDFLSFPLPCTPYKVVANLPYRHTAAIVGKLTTGTSPPLDMHLVMQHEAGQRFMGIPDGTMLATQLAPWFEVSIVHRFHRSDFRPPPAVDSVMVRLRQREVPRVPWHQRPRFADLVAATFSAWKPTADEALRQILGPSSFQQLIAALGRSITTRPSQVDVTTWINLFQVLDRCATPAEWNRMEAANRRLHQQQTALERPTRTRQQSIRRKPPG